MMDEKQEESIKIFFKRTIIYASISALIWVVQTTAFSNNITWIVYLSALLSLPLVLMVTFSNHRYLDVNYSKILEVMNLVLMVFHYIFAWLTISKWGVANLMCIPSLSFIVSILIVIKISVNSLNTEQP